MALILIYIQGGWVQFRLHCVHIRLQDYGNESIWQICAKVPQTWQCGKMQSAFFQAGEPGLYCRVIETQRINKDVVYAILCIKIIFPFFILDTYNRWNHYQRLENEDTQVLLSCHSSCPTITRKVQQGCWLGSQVSVRIAMKKRIMRFHTKKEHLHYFYDDAWLHIIQKRKSLYRED